MNPKTVLCIIILIIGIPFGFTGELAGEFTDVVKHLPEGAAIGVKGWIPYEMRIDKNNYYLPPKQDPRKYIKNFDKNNKKHMNIYKKANDLPIEK